MEGHYNVTLNDKTAGQVTVTKEGLYYKFSCSVRVPKGSRFRLTAYCGQAAVDLGLCIPQGDIYTLCRKIPIKYFDGGAYRFVLSQKEENRVISVDNLHPFPDLRLLPMARFHRESEKAALIIHPKQ